MQVTAYSFQILWKLKQTSQLKYHSWGDTLKPGNDGIAIFQGFTGLRSDLWKEVRIEGLKEPFGLG